MKVNIVARSRTMANALLVLVIIVALADILVRRENAFDHWVWVLAVAAAIGILAPGLMSLAFRDQVNTAWDEQAQDINRRSYVFGYWIVMAVFLLLFALVQLGQFSASFGFFLIAPALVSPALYWVYAAVRGRTD